MLRDKNKKKIIKKAVQNNRNYKKNKEILFFYFQSVLIVLSLLFKINDNCLLYHIITQKLSLLYLQPEAAFVQTSPFHDEKFCQRKLLYILEKYRSPENGHSGFDMVHFSFLERTLNRFENGLAQILTNLRLSFMRQTERSQGFWKKCNEFRHLSEWSMMLLL